MVITITSWLNALAPKTYFAALCALSMCGIRFAAAATSPPLHDVVIRQGTVYDGSGGEPLRGDVIIDGDRITAIGAESRARGRIEIDAQGMAVSPGFINMLSAASESLLIDRRALSDLSQGVTLEVFGEGFSMGPLNARMAGLAVSRQGDLRYPIDWVSLGDYGERLEARGTAVNFASFVGATTIRVNALGEDDVQPDAAQLGQMRALVRQAMQDGALGVGSSLIYAPASYAKTPELIALAEEAGRCGGIYTSHMRSEGDRLIEGITETIEIAKRSQSPAEIYHFKAAGVRNWPKLDAAIQLIEQARRAGTRISANMYTYTVSATGLDAAMPPWVQEGGLERWIARMKDPVIRARIVAQMREPTPPWENLYGLAGAEGTRLLGFKNPALKPLAGRTLADVAKQGGKSAEETAIDLVIEDGSRVEVAYTLMSDANVRREVGLPWISFGSDEGAPAPEGVFMQTGVHPRAYGNFARLLAKYVRDDRVIGLTEAIHRMTELPATNLSLKGRGLLRSGYFADVVVFDAAKIQDHATFAAPQQLASGVRDVFVNGQPVLRAGAPTKIFPGRFVRGRAWTGRPSGGCRGTSNQWTWSP